ncbi:AMP-binding protein [Nonomuraea sp. C10]|uniref:AMP-binding protein n=1 Tax=Nonomuraea sp. C10 TaxID=2600577 RepID=UPI0011CD4248|nr:AMP-binding protein [Nonomuraea sp. C10]TXK40089.1 AMP-binding protein [Nonomuraea sp. C10]
MAGYTFTPLTPTAFLERSAVVHGHRTAIVDGDRRFTYREFGERCRRLAGALTATGVRPGDRVAALCLNSHVMLEAHHGAPWAGASLVSLNPRLSSDEHAYIVRHSGARTIIATAELLDRARDVALACDAELVVAGGPEDDYEDRLAAAGQTVVPVADEAALVAVNYTSGTTGTPKGVMYHHRGAYLQSLAMAYHLGLAADSVYLWTLPMFHCNGWCFTWAVTAAGATHVCQRSFDPAGTWGLVREHGVTHLCAAPTVLTMLAAGHPGDRREGLRVRVATGGAPPSPSLLERLDALAMDVTHLYGLTETFGPIAINEWLPEWNREAPSERARLLSRQGVGNIVADRLRVVDDAGADVPRDGETVGEIAVRGNDVMLGYLGEAPPADDWWRTGDLAVMHGDGYVEIRDRLKDVIISGGENIASVEVERVLESHPAVLECAVVGRPDSTWGEVPVAYVTIRPGQAATEAELVRYVRARTAHFKAPKTVLFGQLPKTSTGKIQKGLLRENLRRSASAGLATSDGPPGD